MGLEWKCAPRLSPVRKKSFQEHLEHRAEILAVLGTCTCYTGGSSHQPSSTLSCLFLPPSASATTHTSPLPTPVCVEHHQRPAEHPVCLFLCMSSPIIKNMAFPNPLPVSPLSIYFFFFLPWTPYKIYHSIHSVLPTPCCSYPLPSCQNILFSSTSSPKSL